MGTVPGTHLTCEGARPGFFCAVYALAVDRVGDIYIAGSDGRILRVDGASGTATPVAGRPLTECVDRSSIVGPAFDVCFPNVTAMAIDDVGNLLIADGIRNAVVRLDRARGEVVLAAGDDSASPCPDGVAATATCIGSPSAITIDAGGGLYIATAGFPVRRVDPASGIIAAVAGRAAPCEDGPPEDDSPALDACLTLGSVAVDADGHIYVGDEWEGRIWRVDATTRRISIFDDRDHPFSSVIALAVGPDQRLVALKEPEGSTGTRAFQYRRELGPGTLVAGNGTFAFCGDGGPAYDACIGSVADLAIGSRAIFIVDAFPRRVRRIDAAGTITTVAGNGHDLTDDPIECPYAAPATETCLDHPVALAADRDEQVYLLEGELYEPEFHNRVRTIDADGHLVTVIGGCRRQGDIDQVPARDACLRIKDIAVGGDGDLYIAEDSRVARLDRASGFLVPVFAVPSDCRRFIDPRPECVRIFRTTIDRRGNVLIISGSRILRVDARTGAVTIVAGNGAGGACGEGGGPAIDACLSPIQVEADAADNLFVATAGAIRRIDAATGVITTVLGPSDASCVNGTGPDCVGAFTLDAEGRVLFVERATGRLLRLTLGSE